MRHFKNTCTQDGYAFTVPENTAAGAVVGRVSASDPDLGRNAELAYSISGRHRRHPAAAEAGSPSSAVRKYLRVDPHTGFVSTRRPVDRERLVAETGQDYFQVGEGESFSCHFVASENVQKLHNIKNIYHHYRKHKK